MIPFMQHEIIYYTDGQQISGCQRLGIGRIGLAIKG